MELNNFKKNLEKIDPKIYLNDQFSKISLQNSLDLKKNILHIASHFVFNGLSDKSTFLLLGTGKKLSLKDIRVDDFDFSGVELLALSACETGKQNLYENGAGKEISGLATIAQSKGAKSVLSTLWSVDDKATAVFMGKFYEKLGKSNSLLKSIKETKNYMQTSKEYNHPFYWSGFILSGDWN